MTRQEAIEILEQMRKINVMTETEAMCHIALCKAIKALEAQEEQGDSISRQVAINEWKHDFKGYVNALNIPRNDCNGIMEYIDELPSAQPKRGRWENVRGNNVGDCSECKGRGRVWMNYCPNCGTRMESEGK